MPAFLPGTAGDREALIDSIARAIRAASSVTIRTDPGPRGLVATLTLVGEGHSEIRALSEDPLLELVDRGAMYNLAVLSLDEVFLHREPHESLTAFVMRFQRALAEEAEYAPCFAAPHCDKPKGHPGVCGPRA